MALSISSKFSMLIALPFMIVYIYKRRGLNKEIIYFISSLLCFTLIFYLPFISSDGFINMVLGTNSVDRIYSVYLSYGNDLKLFIVPVIYIFSLYLVWRLKRITIDLFFISIGVGFFSILVFLPPAPGWTLWVIPFIAYYQITSKKDILLICLLYNIIYILNIINFSIKGNQGSENFFPLLMFNENSFSLKDSLLFTLQQSLGLLIAVRMYIYGLIRNNFYSLSNNSLLISLSGNEKDKIRGFIDSLKDLIYKKDIYITSIQNNILKDSYYYSKSINPDFINKEEKEAYVINYLSKNINKVNTDLENNQRTYQFLLNDQNLDLSTLEKDVNIEILINKFDKRNNNENLFDINNKQLVFIYKCIKKNIYSVITYFPLGFLHTKIFSLLISISSLNVDIELLKNKKLVRMEIQGNPSKEDIYQIAANLIPEIDDFSLRENFWSGGYLGIMQIILFAKLSSILKKKKLNYL